MLDARADATRAERDRRLAEVEEKLRGSFAVRWYRVHELLVPSASVPVTIRRGAREYPLRFRWLLPLQKVAPFRCPHCAAQARLVAGKQRLGCVACTSRPAPPTALPQPAALPAPRSATAPAPRPAAPPIAQPVSRSPRQPSPAPQPAFDAQRCADDGNRLALRLWEDVARADRKLSRLVVPGSPAEVALRVWGSFSPALVIGIASGSPLTDADAGTDPQPTALLQVTAGLLRSNRLMQYPYALRWEGSGRPGSARVAEVLSGQANPNARLTGLGLRWWQDSWRAGPLPVSRIPLDPVARALWQVELPVRGPHLMLRALAAWWRIQDQVRVAAPNQSATAAAVSRLVAACAGTQVSYDAVAADYATAAPAVRHASGELRPLLALSADRGW